MPKTKPDQTLREKAAALAVMASEVLLMVLDEPVEAGTPAGKAMSDHLLDPSNFNDAARAAKPKPTPKRKGRPPMTEEQRAAAKAERDAKALYATPGRPPMTPEQRLVAKAAMDVLTREDMPLITEVRERAAKLQPVTRASLAAALGKPHIPSGREQATIQVSGNDAAPIDLPAQGSSYFTRAE